MSPPRRLTFVVGTGLLSASFATFVPGCNKNHPVNVHPDADGGEEPAAEEGEAPEEPVEPASDTDEPTSDTDEPEPIEDPGGPNVNVVAPD